MEQETDVGFTLFEAFHLFLSKYFYVVKISLDYLITIVNMGFFVFVKYHLHQDSNSKFQIIIYSSTKPIFTSTVYTPFLIHFFCENLA
jgi:hypothetical protein